MSSPINLQSNYPVLPEQEQSWHGLLREAVDLYSAGSLKLPAFGGMLPLREQAAAWLQTEVDRTLVCESGHHGTLAALLAAGLPGKTIAVEALTYPWFVKQTEMLGMRALPVALDAQGMVPEALRALCGREHIDAVYTMPSMHNPTGATASLERRQEIAEVAREFNLTIIDDGAYGFLVRDEPPHYTDIAPERSFYVESLSKRVAPGLRTAFLVSPPQMAEEVVTALRVMASGCSTLLASLGCAMAADGRLAQVIEAKRAEGEVRCAMALQALAAFSVMGEGTSWHLWVQRLPEDKRTDEEFERDCTDRGVLVTTARWFTAPGATVPHATRIGLGGEIERDRTFEGLALVADELRRG